MFGDYFEEIDDAPPDIAWFERLWLSTLACTVFITIMMFDWSVHRVGPVGAAMLTTTRFAGSFMVMLLCSRRRSNFWRWVIAVPFALTIVAYDTVRLPQMMERDFVLPLVVARQILMFAAIWMLFTPRSRAWFAGRPPLP